jgi:drug/metabolite transporter (DMT)-like permease
MDNRATRRARDAQEDAKSIIVETVETPTRRLSDETLGFTFGLIGVLCFSFTLPATRIAVAELDPIFVGLGRALIATALAAPFLYFTRQKRPTRQQFMRLVVVALGVVVGFPLLSAFAMRYTDASHGAIVTGLLPLATAVVSVIRAGERPAPMFWFAAIIGSATVVGFVLLSGDGALHIGDFAMLGAVAVGSLGYVEGGRLARELGSWQTICWALVISAPVLIFPVSASAAEHGLHASPHAWLAFLYVSIFSMFLGFFAWYRGLALGGIARVGQVQLLQAFFTVAWSALLLGETITSLTIVALLIVISMIVVIRRAPIRQRSNAS